MHSSASGIDLGIDPVLLQDVCQDICVRDALAGLTIAEEALTAYEETVKAVTTEYCRAERRAKQARSAFTHRKRLYDAANEARMRALQAHDALEVVEAEWRIARRWLDECVARARLGMHQATEKRAS